MSIHETNPPHPRRRCKTPSFSSILLDSIYRSFDAPDTVDPPTLPTRPSPSPSTQRCYYTHGNGRNNDNDNDKNNSNYAKLRRSKMRSDSTLGLDASLIHTWIHKHQNHDDHHQQQIRYVRQKSVPSTSSPPPSKRVSSSKLFTKTKSRALKLYGDLRRPKQQPQQQPQARSPPVSPGGRFAAFLNSLFRNTTGTPARSLNPTSTSTCSSTSSFSRSCMSKTPSSCGKSSTTSTETKRSVRFYPLSVIVDGDSKPCGHKSLRKPSEGNQVNDNNNNVKRTREKEIDTLMMMIKRDCFRDHGFESREEHINENNDENEDEDDDESCVSSDLFELENLSSIGVSRYSQELPVYGTTSLHNLRA